MISEKYFKGFQKLFESSFDLICIADMNGFFRYVNNSFVKLLGFSHAELLEQSFLNLVHPEDLIKTNEELARNINGIGSVHFENRYLCKDGSYKILEWYSTGMLEEKIILAVAKDITRFRTIDEEKKRAQEFAEVILESVPNMIFVKDAKELKFLQFNRAGEELLGYSRKDLINKNDYDFFPKSEADFFTSKDRKVFEEGKVVEIPEEPIHTKQGQKILRTKKIPVYDKDGHPLYLLGISEDITETKKLNEERERNEVLLRSAERINKLIQNSMDAVVGFNEKSIINSWNIQAENIFEIKSEEAIGKSIIDLIPVRFRVISEFALKNFLCHHSTRLMNQRIESSALRKDIEFPVEVTITPIWDNECCQFYASVRDISARKILEKQQKFILQKEHEAREAAEKTINMQDDFLSVAAHELKTPITPINLQLQLIEKMLIKAMKEQFNPKTTENLLKLINGSKKEMDRLISLINELLDVSRISADRLLLHKEKMDLSELLNSQIRRYSELASKEGCHITHDIQPNIVGLWDKARLDIVLQNLISNAIKYGNCKPIYVRAWTKDKMAFFIVRDMGIGIPSNFVPKLFDKFERAVPVQKFSGLGLGLYISKKIIDAHSGEIAVETELDIGSTFIIKLPL